MDEVIARLVELKQQRDDAQAEIDRILGGATIEKEKRLRAPQKCSVCQQEGHSARTCPTKQDGKLPALSVVE